MTTYTHPLGLDAQLNNTISKATQAVLLSSYSRTDNYAAVVANILVTVAIDSSATYFDAPADAGDDRFARFLGASGTATVSSPPTPDLHQAIISESEVLLVTDELSDRDIVLDDVVTLAAFSFQASQPTQVTP